MRSCAVCIEAAVPRWGVPRLVLAAHSPGPLQGCQGAGEDPVKSQSCPGLLLGHCHRTLESWESLLGFTGWILIPLPVTISSRLCRLLQKLSSEMRDLAEVRCQDGCHMGAWGRKTVSNTLHPSLPLMLPLQRLKASALGSEMFSGPFMQYKRQELSIEVNSYRREKQAGVLNKTILLIQNCDICTMHMVTHSADDSSSYTPWTLKQASSPCLRLIYLILLYLKASTFHLPSANTILLAFIHFPVYIIWILTLPFKSLQTLWDSITQTLCKLMNK